MYDEKKDKLIKLFELEKEKQTILFKVMSYNNAAPKLSVSSMYKKRDGSTGYGKVSRLGKEELEYLAIILPDILEEMKNFGSEQ